MTENFDYTLVKTDNPDIIRRELTRRAAENRAALARQYQISLPAPTQTASPRSGRRVIMITLVAVVFLAAIIVLAGHHLL